MVEEEEQAGVVGEVAGWRYGGELARPGVVLGGQ